MCILFLEGIAKNKKQMQHSLEMFNNTDANILQNVSGVCIAFIAIVNTDFPQRGACGHKRKEIRLIVSRYLLNYRFC